MYQLLKFLIGWGLRLYYREIHIVNHASLQKKGPLILIANHPNTLMDAWLIALYARKDLYFLTKGTFFNSPIKRWFLRNLNMIPINRNVEERTKGVHNQDSFEACYEVLREGKCLVIFPEGNSIMERLIRTFKTGTARIALHSESSNQGKLDIQVVPLGLFYSKGDSFRSAIYMEVGEPICVKDYLKEYESDKQPAVKKLTQTMQTSIESLLFSFSSKEEEELMEELEWIHQLNIPNKKVRHLFHEYQMLHQRVKNLTRHEKALKEVRNALVSIQKRINQLNIHSTKRNSYHLIERFDQHMLVRLLWLIPTLPILIYGMLHSIIPFKLTGLLVPKLVKNKEFYAPVAVLLGLLFYPLTYLTFCWMFYTRIDSSFLWTSVYFISLPVSGMFSYYLFHEWMLTKTGIRTLLIRKEKRKATIDLLSDIAILKVKFDSLSND
jgi:1-acyl-sn-glycerol-3-phosphate acyltransferase